MSDQEEDFAAAVSRLDAARPRLSALGAPAEREAELLGLLRQAADSYWRRRRLPPIPSGLQPSVTKRRLPGLRRSIRKIVATSRGLSPQDRVMLETLVGRDRLAAWLELSETMAAELDDVETVAEFAAPERFDTHLALLVDHLASIFTEITGSRPTRTWSDKDEDFTSPFFRFARAAVVAIDPQVTDHGSVDEAIKRTCAKHPEDAAVARRARRPS